MLKKLREWFKKAWDWIEALWDKHDDQITEMVSAVLPMVIDLAFRSDLTGEQKRKAIIDTVIDNAEATARDISTSMLNEAVEIATNRYNIQIGKTTIEAMDAAQAAALKAARDFANNNLQLTGTEAEDAGVTPTVPDEVDPA